MTTHILTRIGAADHTLRPSLGGNDTCVELGLGRHGDKGAIQSNAVEECCRRGLTPPHVCMDLLHLASAVYSADIGVPRETGFDSWTRDLVLHFPALRKALWEAQRAVVEELLSFLTGDHWVVHFRDLPEADLKLPDVKTVVFDPKPNWVSLFSGGLDSFIGAVDRLESGEPTVLVGHHGLGGTTNKAQQNVFPVLDKHYPGICHFLPFYLQQPTNSGGKLEKTTRSRSIVFLALGATVAACLGPKTPLLVPENGLISINRPLTAWRMGSLSTRTTHPHFISLFRQLLTGLGLGVDVQVPYRFHTKGEMSRDVLGKAAFRDGWAKTVSCSHPDVGRYRKKSPGQHCGYCVPCIIRRASLASVGLDDPSMYLEDVVGADQSWDAARSDLRCFQLAAATFDERDRRRHLFDVLETGPIPPSELAEYAAVYRRGMLEVRQFLANTVGATV